MYNRDNARFQAADIDKDGELMNLRLVNIFKYPLRDEMLQHLCSYCC